MNIFILAVGISCVPDRENSVQVVFVSKGWTLVLQTETSVSFDGFGSLVSCYIHACYIVTVSIAVDLHRMALSVAFSAAEYLLKRRNP